MASNKEKRRFRRYKLASECLISFEEKSYQGNITDYSLKGIGVSFRGLPPLLPGSNARIRIDELNLDDEGTIVWSRNEDNSFIAGFEKNSVSGILKYFPPADILNDLQRSEKNGILIVGNGPVMKKIYIKNGAMVYATSNSNDDQLIEVVKNTDRITDDQYRELHDIAQNTNKPHGALLVEQGYLRPEEIVVFVKKQVEGIVLSIFSWDDGRFSFFEGPRFSDKVIILKLSTADLIYRGIRESSHSAAAIHENLPPGAVLAYAADSAALLQELTIQDRDKNILSLVDGKRSVGELLSLSPLADTETILILYALLSARILESRSPQSAENGMTEEGAEDPAATIDPEFLRHIDSLYRSLDSTDHYSFLGIEKRASQDIIRKAYYIAAKEYHPDRHLHLGTADVKNKLNAIFSHLTEVYKTLSSAPSRQKYDDTLSTARAPLPQSAAEMARARFDDGVAAFRRGAFAEAKELFGQAIYLDGSVSGYHFHLGNVFLHEKNFSEAVKMFNKALTMDPRNADYLSELGHVYLRLGFHLRAKSTFEKAIQSDPHNKRAITGLHMLQSQSGS